MKKCKNCNNSSFKETTIQHSINTRDENRRVLNIENLPIKECKICGLAEMPERSEEIIDTLKHIVQQEMDRAVKMEKEQTGFKETKETSEMKEQKLGHLVFPSISSLLKRFIG